MVLQEVADYVGGVHATHSLCKTLVIITLHAGDYTHHLPKLSSTGHSMIPATPTCPFLVALATEVATLADALLVDPAYAKVTSAAYKSCEAKDEPSNLVGCFISKLCQRVEDACVMYAREFLTEQGYVVGALVFDGCMVECKVPGEGPIPDDLLRSLEEYVLAKTGFAVGWLEKVLEMQVEDYVYYGYRPPTDGSSYFPAFTPETKIVVPANAVAPYADDYITCAATQALCKRRQDDRAPVDMDDDKKRLFPDAVPTDPVIGSHGKLSIRPIHFPEGIQAVVYIASMGLGKSHNAAIFLRNNPSAKVVLLSCRVQHANSYLEAYHDCGLTLYTQEDFDPEIHTRCVVQYESLHRLVKDDRFVAGDYDYVIIDELRSVINQACSPHNGTNASWHMHILKSLVANRKLIAMDADIEIDPMCANFLDKLVPPSRRLVLRYNHVALPRSVNLVSPTNQRLSIKAALTRGEKVGMVFRTRRQMKEFLKLDWLRAFRVMSFSSGDPDDHINKFRCIDDHLEEVDLLCFTSKVTVGADIQRVFHWVFVDATGFKGPTCRELLQMAGRFRNLINRILQITLSTTAPTFETELDSIVSKTNQLKQAVTHIDKFFSKMHCEVQTAVRCDMQILDNHGCFIHTPGLLMETYVISSVEGERNLSEDFAALVIKKNIRVGADLVEVDDDAAVEMDKMIKEAKDKIKGEKEAMTASLCEQVLGMEGEARQALADAISNEQRSRASKGEERAELRNILIARGRFDGTPFVPSPEGLRYMLTNPNEVRMRQIFLLNDSKLTDYSEARAMDRAFIPETRAPLGEGVRRLHELFQHFPVSLSNIPFYTKEKFKDNPQVYPILMKISQMAGPTRARIGTECKAVFADLGMRVCGGGDSVAQTINMLRRALNIIGLTVVRSKVVRGEPDRDLHLGDLLPEKDLALAANYRHGTVELSEMEKEPDSDDHAAAIVLRQQQFDLTLRTIFPEDYALSVSYGGAKGC